MRREWTPEELVEGWTLLEDDWRLVGNKTGATRLGFAVLLKFFELEARFPRHAGEVPRAAVDYLAGQVKVERGVENRTILDTHDPWPWTFPGSDEQAHRIERYCLACSSDPSAAQKVIAWGGTRPCRRVSSHAATTSTPVSVASPPAPRQADIPTVTVPWWGSRTLRFDDA